MRNKRLEQITEAIEGELDNNNATLFLTDLVRELIEREEKMTNILVAVAEGQRCGAHRMMIVGDEDYLRPLARTLLGEQ